MSQDFKECGLDTLCTCLAECGLLQVGVVDIYIHMTAHGHAAWNFPSQGLAPSVGQVTQRPWEKKALFPESLPPSRISAFFPSI